MADNEEAIFPNYVDESKLVKDPHHRAGHWVYPPTDEVFSVDHSYRPGAKKLKALKESTTVKDVPENSASKPENPADKVVVSDPAKPVKDVKIRVATKDPAASVGDKTALSVEKQDQGEGDPAKPDPSIV